MCMNMNIINKKGLENLVLQRKDHSEKSAYTKSCQERKTASHTLLKYYIRFLSSYASNMTDSASNESPRISLTRILDDTMAVLIFFTLNPIRFAFDLALDCLGILKGV